jgi:kumamolisin
MFSAFVALFFVILSLASSTHVPPQVSRSSDIGKMDSTHKLDFVVALNLNKEAELDYRLHQMYDPSSLNFHHFMTTEEFISEYAPTQAQVDSVTSHMQTFGIHVTSVSANRLLLHARGSVGALNSMLNTDMHYYRYDGEVYFAPSVEFQLPAELPIQAVHGLYNFSSFKSYAHQGKSLSPNLIQGYFTPTDIRTAYNIPYSIGGSLAGAGQTLALFELDGYKTTDISTYCSYFGLRAVPLQNVYVDGVTGTPGSGAAEVTLDIELMIALAQGATKIIVYEGPNNAVGIIDTYNRMAVDNLASQASSSWGAHEGVFASSFYVSEYNIFKQMAAQGQSFYVAAGDGGAYDGTSTLVADDPAAQPYVVAVGGTKLVVNSATSAYVSETTWHEATNSAGGGGISKNWAQPFWQNGLSYTSNKGSTVARNVPDVSLDSDPATGYVIVLNGALYAFGGTSCAAPLWAAFNALVNQQRSLNGLGKIGFPSPALYQIGKETSNHYGYHDIADGSNNDYYPAVSGYDLATGWGSFNGAILLQILSSPPSVGVYITNYGPNSFTMSAGQSVRIA